MLTEKDYKEFAGLASRLAESILMDWDKDEQVRLAKEVATKCHSIFNDKESREFVSLVKRMREAQKQWKDGDPFDGSETELAKKMCEAERKVDEYLKKMENIDQRKALEAENTEFDYGHNVKHYSED